ncbi:MAG: DUF3368 domain-containing protein, partial [Nostoc sp.]
MIVVSDTTPLSELSKVGRLDLLQAVFGRVIIPQQVYAELTTGDHPAVLAVKSALWLEVISISNNQLIEQLQLETDLDLGECSAIILAE